MRRARRGRAVWQHLTALVVVPLLAAGLLGAMAVRLTLTDRARADEAQLQLAASVQLDALRRALDQELLPTLTVATVDDDDASAAAGLTGALRMRLQVLAPAQLVAARARTDAALSTVQAQPALVVASRARQQLRAARASADQSTVGAGILADTYLRVSDAVAVAERTAAVRAAAAVTSTASAAAINDVNLVVDLSGVASRQLPLLFAARVLGDDEGAAMARGWFAATGSWLRLASTPGSLSTAQLRTGWYRAAVTGPAAVAAQPLSDTGALAGGSTLSPAGVLDLTAASSSRDTGLTALLDEAVEAASASVTADRVRAESELQGTVALCVLVVALTTAVMAVQARGLTRSLRALAAAAARTRDGFAVRLDGRGPREVRDAGEALLAASTSLRRVREQAEAVARGDLQAALEGEPVPGRLGEVVHRSVQAMVRAVEARDALRAELADRAAHDALTRLPNRATTLNGLSEALDRAQSAGTSVAVLFVDLDGFKSVNDTLGHAAGDEVLRTVAARLLAEVRGGDVVGRLGGDEFVVVAEGVDEVDVADLGARIVESVRVPVEVAVQGEGGTSTARVGASIGVSLATADAASAGTPVDADALLAEADVAVYRAKALGKGRVVVFDAELRRQAAERTCAQVALRGALDGTGAGPELLLQPMAAAGTGDVLGWRASLRWEGPAGPLDHAALQRAAAQAGLDTALGRWALRAACTHLAGRGGLRDDVVTAVGLSVRHVADPAVLDDVADALLATGLAPERLVVEVAEAGLADDHAALRSLRALRLLGVGVAVGGVRPGTTSLQQLVALPAARLTLDREVVTSSDPGHVRFVALLARACRATGTVLAADGVSTEDDAARLVAGGCAVLQGPYVSAPLAAGEVDGLDLAALGARVLAAGAPAGTAAGTALSAPAPR